MFYIEAKTLVDLAIQHGVLETFDNHIAIYRLAGADPERFPEGWYLEERDAVCHDLMLDTEGQEILTKALLDKGVDVRPLLERLHEMVEICKREVNENE